MFRNRDRSRLNRVITAHEMSPISREDKIFIATFFSRDEKMSRDDRNVVKQGLRRIRKCTLRSCLSVSNVSDNTYKGTWVHGCLNYDLCICIYFFKGSLRKTKKNIPNLPVRYCIIRNTKKLDFFGPSESLRNYSALHTVTKRFVHRTQSKTAKYSLHDDRTHLYDEFLRK